VLAGRPDWFLGLTSLPFGGTVRRVHSPCGEETAVDTTVAGIGSVVVAELRAAGYRESTIGQYQKSIRALTGFVEAHGGFYTPGGLFTPLRRSVGR